ncbi:sulfite exporter TauE/SafE family protein [Ruminococcaceae bacterium OttesenSCG-928-A11]|nr:sulfite exporter TauE/SafE family protein [Ruminococcaceae bacterium OttesenSCG-928-A11]
MITLVPLALIALVSAFIQGLTGFGFPLLAVPLFSFILPVRVAVPITTVLSLSVNAGLLREVPNICPRRREALLILAAAVFTIPLGVVCLKYVETANIKILLGAVALVCTFLLWAGLRLPMRRLTLWSLGIGLGCGFLAGLANLAGPLLILYLNNLELEKKVFRAFTVLMFTVMNGFSLVSSAVGGLVTGTVLLYALVMIPLVLLGTWLGTRLGGRVNEKVFRKLTLAILAATSISTLISGISALN